jgi:probable O-glycosylation ligase (exosortase A-associated)
MILVAFSIIGSQSRGAFLGTCAMVAFLVIKSRQRVLFGMLVAAVLVISAAFVPQTWINRMKTIETYQQDGSALGRLEVWGFAIKIARDHPMVGGGFRVSYDDDIYLKYVPDAITGHGRNFHSVYFEVLGELGYVGLFTYLALLLAAWRSGSRTIALAKNRPDLHWASDLARMAQVSLVGFVVTGAFQNLAFFDLYFFLVAVLFVSHCIVLRQLEVCDPAQPQPVGLSPKSFPRFPRPV